MIAIILIALAAGCASALMFASIVSGALISLLLFYLAPLPLMVAALGWGPLCATIGGIAAAIGLGAIFGLPYCIAFVGHGRAARLVARPSRAAGPAGREQRDLAGNGAAADAADAGMVSGRPHPALDRGLCRTDHDGGAADAGHRRRDHHRRHTARPVAGSRSRDAAITGETRTRHRRAGDDRAGGRRDRRHDDADAQSLAGRQNHRDLGTAAPSLARSEKRRAAADDARGACRSRSRSVSSAACSPCWRRSSPRR